MIILFQYVLSRLAKIKCSICSFQCENWKCTHWVHRFHLYFWFGQVFDIVYYVNTSASVLCIALSWSDAHRPLLNEILYIFKRNRNEIGYRIMLTVFTFVHFYHLIHHHRISDSYLSVSTQFTSIFFFQFSLIRSSSIFTMKMITSMTICFVFSQIFQNLPFFSNSNFLP